MHLELEVLALKILSPQAFTSRCVMYSTAFSF